MRIRAPQLARELSRRLAPLYVIAGDEPLLAGECLDTIVTAARAAGFSERSVLTVDAVFDWSVLRAEFASLSLFAERRIIDLRLPDGKPGDEGGKVLREYAAAPGADLLLVVSCGRVDRRGQQARWFKALEDAGAVVEVAAVTAQELPRWLTARAAGMELALSPAAAELLAERAEGNLLAAAQELAKLRLLVGAGRVEDETVRAAVADSARYNLFELADVALVGDAARAVRVLHGLREEGTAPQLVCWALLRELRTLAPLAHDLGAGQPLARVLDTHRVWDKRKRAVGSALQRHPGRAWLALLGRGFAVDAVVKGAPGSPWDALEALVLALCGVRLAGGYV